MFQLHAREAEPLKTGIIHRLLKKIKLTFKLEWRLRSTNYTPETLCLFVHVNTSDGPSWGNCYRSPCDSYPLSVMLLDHFALVLLVMTVRPKRVDFQLMYARDNL